MKQAILSLAFVVVALACGGGNEKTSTRTNSQGQTCSSSHECINDSCTCTSGPKKGNACDTDDKCVAQCETCS